MTMVLPGQQFICYHAVIYNTYRRCFTKHLYTEFDCNKCFWLDLVQCFQISLVLPTFTPQAAIFGFFVSAIGDSKYKELNS